MYKYKTLTFKLSSFTSLHTRTMNELGASPHVLSDVIIKFMFTVRSAPLWRIRVMLCVGYGTSSSTWAVTLVHPRVALILPHFTRPLLTSVDEVSARFETFS